MSNTQEASDKDELLKNTASDGGQAGETVSSKDYKELEAEFTRTKQEAIEFAIKTAEEDGKKILSMSPKMQAKVLKKLYNVDSLNELYELHGENFLDEKRNTEGNDNDDLDEIKRELKAFKYNANKEKREALINEFIKNNKLEGDDVFEKIKAEVSFVSKELSLEEQVNRAGKIVMSDTITKNPYLFLKEEEVKGGVGAGEQKQKVQDDFIDDVFNRVFKKTK